MSPYSSDTATLLGQRVTGNGHANFCDAGSGCYTDKFLLTFTANDTGCHVEACSESQGPSFYDFDTNYCNMHVLWCSAAEGCPSVHEDALTYTEEIVSCHAGLTEQHDAAVCIADAPATISGLLVEGNGSTWTDDGGPPAQLASSSGVHSGVDDLSFGAGGLFTAVLMLLFLLLACGAAGGAALALARRRRRSQAAADRHRRADAALGRNAW